MGSDSMAGKRDAAEALTTERSGPLYDTLVPVRLDLVVDGKHTTESFTWNTLETEITPRSFATRLVHDLELGSDLIEELTNSIQEQLDSWVPAKRARTSDGSGESRQIVRLNLRMGRVVLRDQFEWDLEAPENCPESFATQLCVEMGLGTGYAPHVAHALREQLNDLADLELKRPSRAAVDTKTVLRSPNEAIAWQPRVDCLTVEEQTRLERKEKREARLQRRNRGKQDTYATSTTAKQPRVRYNDPPVVRRRNNDLVDLDSNSRRDSRRRR